MAFEEWLALGGNEIINNARTVGYAKTAACPMAWFKGRTCPTLAAATLNVALYHTSAIEAAPWYDTALPEISRRFYGAYGLSISGIEDSTRTASVTEGLSDGGVIGRVRKAPREVRVVALLAGEGRDALEYGMAWLNAALDPNACGQHGDACGTADLAYFSDCPPARRDVPIYSDPVLAATNLNPNPSMETPGPVVELRRNLVRNPKMRTTTGWGANAGILTGTESGLQVHVIDAQPTNTLLFNQAQPWPGISANERGVASMDIEVRPDSPAVTLQLRLEMRDGGGQYPGAPVTIQPGQTARIYSGIGVPGPATMFRILVYAGAATAGSTEFIARNALLERKATHLPYFDGSTEDYTNSPFTYAWAGDADNSESTQSAPSVLHYGQDGLVTLYQTRSPDSQPARGEYALRAVAGSASSTRGDVRVNGVALTPGATYTVEADLYLPEAHALPDESPVSRQRRILVYENGGETTNHGPQAPNVAGWHHLTHQFIAPATGQTILALGSAGSAEDTYFESIWDAVSITEGPQSALGYFDGDTEDTDLEVYEWVGTPHDSASTATTQTLLGTAPEPPEDYLHEVNKVRRYLHDVAAVSGPLVQAEFQSGPHWAYQVEFTMVAANPYVFGVTQRLDLPPRLPTVIGDVPYNLVPYPSAELSSGSIVIAKNYVINPSVEVDNQFWIAYGDVLNPAEIAGSRSTALAAHGSASHLAEFRPSTTGADPNANLFGETITADFPATNAQSKMTVSMWASASVISGSAVLGDITIYGIWQDAAGNHLGVIPHGTLPAAGGAITVKSYTPPLGSVKCAMRASLSVPSWNAGAVIDLFADAVAVTVP